MWFFMFIGFVLGDDDGTHDACLDCSNIELTEMILEMMLENTMPPLMRDSKYDTIKKPSLKYEYSTTINPLELEPLESRLRACPEERSQLYCGLHRATNFFVDMLQTVICKLLFVKHSATTTNLETNVL